VTVSAPIHDSSTTTTAIAPRQTLLPSNFTLYYIPASISPDAQLSVWFRVKQKVSSETELQRYLCSFPAHARHPLLLWQPRVASASSSTKVPSPTKDEAPVLASDQDAGSTGSSRSSASSRESAVQAVFANAVRIRDGAQCIVCRDPTVNSVELQAAHIVPVSGDRANQWQAAGLSSVYDTRNGLVLCVSCHFFFDRGLWCIDPVNRSRMIVTQALAQRRPQEWGTRNGQPVLHATPFHADWPTAQTLKVQSDFMQNQTAERHAEQAKRKFECPFCGRRYASDTSVHFTRHLLTHSGQPKGQWKYFHTPIKKK
jgi:hypothetical protein